MFRTKPESLKEMLKWNMISYSIYMKLRHLSFEAAKREIDTFYGYQTWSFGEHHILEYIKTYDVDVCSFTKHEWIRHCLILSKGRMNPIDPAKIYDEFFLKMNKSPLIC